MRFVGCPPPTVYALEGIPGASSLLTELEDLQADIAEATRRLTQPRNDEYQSSAQQSLNQALVHFCDLAEDSASHGDGADADGGASADRSMAMLDAYMAHDLLSNDILRTGDDMVALAAKAEALERMIVHAQGQEGVSAPSDDIGKALLEMIGSAFKIDSTAVNFPLAAIAMIRTSLISIEGALQDLNNDLEHNRKFRFTADESPQILRHRLSEALERLFRESMVLGTDLDCIASDASVQELGRSHAKSMDESIDSLPDALTYDRQSLLSLQAGVPDASAAQVSADDSIQAGDDIGSASSLSVLRLYLDSHMCLCKTLLSRSAPDSAGGVIEAHPPQGKRKFCLTPQRVRQLKI